jgi:mono/diheme cytochrome c family protein
MKYYVMLLVGLTSLIGACAAPRNLPEGPTPIPTLAPATEPASPLSATAAPVFNIQSYPARSPSAERGESVYQANCASCHGVDGRGVVPGARNFNDLDYVRGETPAAFYAATSEGRREMPAFRGRLTSDQIWDVVFYIWRFSTDAETLALGEHLYEANCTACHGTQGSGEVLGASDFSDLRLTADQAPRDFYLITTQGKGSMPAWQGRLSQAERWAVINYVRTFSYDPTLPGEVTAEPPPTATAAETACDPALLSQSNPFGWDDADAMAAGQLIYDQACAVCHGVDGAGALPGTSDYTSPDASAGLRTSGGETLCVIAEGRGSMPGWKETLSVEQMWQVLTYMASFGE